MKNKRALFLVLTDHQGGAESVAAMLANRLSQSGWRVEWRIADSRAVLPSHCASAIQPEIEVRRGRFGGLLPGFLSLPFRLAGGGYDLVFTTHVYTNAMLSVMRALRLLRVRRFVSRESTVIFDRFRGLRRLLFAALYRLYGGQDMIVAQTAYMAQHVKPHLPARCQPLIAVLPNPVDLDAIDAAMAEDPAADIAKRLAGRINILFCGRLIGVKQPLLALEVFRRVLTGAPADVADRLQLVYMGDGPLRADIEKEIRARSLEGSVALLGRQANPYAIMIRCQYGLMTSSVEGFPNVVLEMMACGVKKIVMTPCAGDLNDLHGVTVTEDFAAGSLSDALTASIRAEDDFSAAYRKLVEQRTPEAYLDAILGRDTP